MIFQILNPKFFSLLQARSPYPSGTWTTTRVKESSTTESATWTTAASTSQPRSPSTRWRSSSSITHVRTRPLWGGRGLGFITGGSLNRPPPLSPCRRFRRFVHEAGEAVSVEGAAEALVAGRVGDPPWVPEAGAQAWGRAVWRSLDGWVTGETEEGGQGLWVWLRGGHEEPFTRVFLQRVQNSFLTTAFNCRFELVNWRISKEVFFPVVQYLYMHLHFHASCINSCHKDEVKQKAHYYFPAQFTIHY